MDLKYFINNKDKIRNKLLALPQTKASSHLLELLDIPNTELIDAMEVSRMIDVAQTVCAGALQRTETRGAHAREDYSSRDDGKWLRHSLIRKSETSLEINYKPVTISWLKVNAGSAAKKTRSRILFFIFNSIIFMFF